MEKRVIRKVLSLPKERYYEMHLTIVNSLLPVKMAPKEIEVLALFMSIDTVSSRYKFGKESRVLVKRLLGLSDGGLGNHLNSLRDKGCILLDEAGLVINPLFNVDREEQVYEFKLINID